ncbi:hypothetical protein PHSC3_001830 [Chlamydiales bacterium STE3]|nr:hypothetical protein PHSC3_001830 [Chlamydiales bacterium STE3]
MKYFFYFIVLVVFSSCSPHVHEQTISLSKEDLTLISEALAEQNRKTEFSIDQPHLIVKRIPIKDVPGFSAKCNENVEMDPLIALGVEAVGLSPGEEFSFYVFTTRNPGMWMGNFIANDEGRLISPRYLSRAPYFFYELLKECRKGEEFSFVLISKDKQKCIAASYIPDPISAKWKDGASVNLISLDEDCTTFQLVGRGFQPNEMLKTISISCGEFGEINFNTQEDGTFRMLLSPAVVGYPDGGEARFIIKRKRMPVKTLRYYHGKAAKIKKTEIPYKDKTAY